MDDIDVDDIPKTIVHKPIHAASKHAGLKLRWRHPDTWVSQHPLKASELDELDKTVQSCLADGRLGEAMTAAVRAFTIFSQEEDTQGEAEAQAVIAGIHLQRGGLQEACLAARSAEKLFKKVGDTRGQAVLLLLVVARVQCLRHQNDAALQQMREAASLFKVVQDPEGEGAALGAVALQHLQMQQLEEAIAASREAASFCYKAGDPAGEGSALLTAVDALLLTGDGHKAFSRAKDAVAALQKTSDGAQQGFALHAVARACLAKGLYQDALMEATAAVNKLESVKCMRGVAIAQQTIAEALLAAGKPEQAVFKANEAMALSHQLAEKQDEAAALEIVSRSHMSTQNWADALQALKDAMVLYWDLDDGFSACRVLHMVARVRFENGEYPGARYAANQAYLLACEFTENRTRAELLLLVGRALLKQHSRDLDAQSLHEEDASFQRAQHFIRKDIPPMPREACQAMAAAVDIYRKMGAKKDLAGALLELSEAQLIKHHPARALSTSQEAHKLCAEFGDQYGKANSLLQEANAHLANHAVEQAMKAAESAADLFRHLRCTEKHLQAIQTLKAATANRKEERRVATPAISSAPLLPSKADGLKPALKPQTFAWKKDEPAVVSEKMDDITTREQVSPCLAPETSALDLACETCGSRDDDGAYGTTGTDFENKWFCRSCWVSWLDATLQGARLRRNQKRAMRKSGYMGGAELGPLTTSAVGQPKVPHPSATSGHIHQKVMQQQQQQLGQQKQQKQAPNVGALKKKPKYSRVDLITMTLGELMSKAQTSGISVDGWEKAMDSEDPRESFIEFLCSH